MVSRRVGVEVKTSAVHTAIPPAVPGAGTVFVVGVTERGSLTAPVVLESMTDYETKLGGPISASTAYWPVNALFRSGVQKVIVQRVAGTVPVKATLTLKDNSTSPGINTIRLDAVDPGEFGNDLRVVVDAGTRALTEKLTITRLSTGQVVVSIDNIARTADGSSWVNALAGSRWVRAVALGTGNGIPRPLTTTAMASGTADLSTLTTPAQYTNALALFSAELGAGAIIIPGQSAADITAALAVHCEANNRIGLVSPPLGTSKSATLAMAETLLASGKQWVGMFWPWVSFEDGLVKRFVDPAVMAAACRAMAHGQGAWQAASAYPFNVSKVFTGAEALLTRTDVNDLATGNVNGIVLKNGQAALRAWFPLTEDVDYPTMSVRDLLNVMSVDVDELLDEATVWQTLDGHNALPAVAKGLLVGYLENIRSAGGIFERVVGQTEVDPGYVITFTSTLQDLQQSEFRIHIGVRPSPHAALVTVEIVKVAVGSPL